MMKSRSSEAFKGILWMLAGSGGAQFLTFVITIVLARILIPDDFAAVSLIMAVLAIAQTFTEMGFSVAVVQREVITSSVLDSAFVLTVFSFLLIAAAIFFFSDAFATYYSLPLLSSLTRMAAFSFFFQGMASFYRSLLLRDKNFRLISFIILFTICINGAISITLANWDYGAYSILWGQIGANICAFSTLFIVRRFVPRSFGSLKEMRALLIFGAWVSLGRVLGAAAGQFDRFLIGKLLPAKTLGGYHLASQITMALPGLLTSIVDQVLLPIYSNAKNDASVIERGYWKGLRYSSMLIVPASILLAVYARPIVYVFMGDKWLFIIPIIQIISVFSVFQGLGGGIFASAIYASGIPYLTAITNCFRIIALPSCVWIGSQWGVIGVAWGVAIYGILGRFFNQWLLKIYLGYNFFKFLQVIAKPIMINCFLLACGFLLQSFIVLDNPISTALITCACIFVAVSLYSAACFIILREDSIFLLRHFFNLFKMKRA